MKLLDKLYGVILEKKLYFLISFLLAVLSIMYVQNKAHFLGPETIISNKVIYGIFFILFCVGIGIFLFFNTKWGKIKHNIFTVILIWLPSEIIFLWGISIKGEFNNLIHLGVGVYIILIGAFILGKYYFKNIRSSEKKINIKEWIKQQGWVYLFLVTIITSIFFSFGFHNIEKQALVDEPLWLYKRIPKFWKNIAEKDWLNTRVSDKPGTTVAYLSGVGLLWENPKEYKSIKWQGFIYSNPKNLENLNRAMRVPLFIFIVFSLPLFYFLTERLLGKTVALFSYLFIGLSPILLGMSRMINPDALLWLFLPLSFLAHLNFLKNRKLLYIFLTGLFLGLSLLTKYVSNILVAFFLGMIFLEYIFNKNNTEKIQAYIKKSLIDFGSIVFIALSFFYILYPAVWLKPKRLLIATIYSEAFEKNWPIFVGIIIFLIADYIIFKSRGFEWAFNKLEEIKYELGYLITFSFLLGIGWALFNTYSGMHFIPFEEILASPKSAYSKNGFLGIFSANFYPLIFGISPLVLTSVIFYGMFILKKNNLISEKLRVAIYLITFTLFYYFASTVSHVGATVRYQIIIYPLIFILSAMGIENFLLWMNKYLKYSKKEIILATLIIIVSLVSLFKLNSLYFSYASSLLPEKYVLNLKDMGDGSYEAAEYLNKIPEAYKLNIWSDKSGVCEFFIGNCSVSMDFKKLMLNKTKFDYYVVSVGRRAKNTRDILNKVNNNAEYLVRFDKLYDYEKPEYQINLGNRKSNYIKIIRAEDIDISYIK